MPTISMFYGIIVSMFFEIKEKHHLPHIHVRYQGSSASISIEDGVLLAGDLPTRGGVLGTVYLIDKRLLSAILHTWRELDEL
jgi:hypothetical protein